MTEITDWRPLHVPCSICGYHIDVRWVGTSPEFRHSKTKRKECGVTAWATLNWHKEEHWERYIAIKQKVLESRHAAETT